MNRKIAAVLLRATMLTTPAFAASVASSANTPTAQTVNSHKVTTTSDKGVKKHRVHARSSHGHKVHHAKQRNQTRSNTLIRFQKRVWRLLARRTTRRRSQRLPRQKLS